MPMRLMVAGDAQLRGCHRSRPNAMRPNLRSWVSNTKLTLGPNWMRSPDGMVSSRLSSSTELSDSIHSGSMSPSQMIHDCTSSGSLTTWASMIPCAVVAGPSLSRAEGENTVEPLARVHVNVAQQPLPMHGLGVHGVVLQRDACLLQRRLQDAAKQGETGRSRCCHEYRHSAVLPEPDGPTITTPMRWRSCS